jgi:DNA-binding transcriptional ArsR family regulator
LYFLLDRHARTSTELAVAAEVSASTAGDHLSRLKDQGLVTVLAQGRHRYYSLEGDNVAAVLEALTVVVGQPARRFVPHTPQRLRIARTCYDHIAGHLAIALHDRFSEWGWLVLASGGDYDVTPEGRGRFLRLGVDLEATRDLRRRFAHPCVDWSERRPHLGGALGAAFLQVVLKKGWLVRDWTESMSQPPGFSPRYLRTATATILASPKHTEEFGVP